MILQFKPGFAAFMDAATEGWSLVAVRAPIERVARVFQQRDEVLAYEEDVTFRPLRGHPQLQLERAERWAFLLQLAGNPWSVLLRTVDWITPGDALGVRRWAAELSSRLVTEALSSVGAYHGAECRRFRFGQEVGRVDTDDPETDFLSFCAEHDFQLPACFIGGDEIQATLYLDDLAPAELRRVDRLRIQA
ncbi:MAG: hypothetical protein U0935_03335 [Pirellulales bacterium]